MVDAFREGNTVGLGTTTTLWSDDPWKKNQENSSVPTTTTTHIPVVTNANYDAVVAWCRHHIQTGSDFLFQPDYIFQATLQDAATTFDFPIESLHSLFRNLHVHFVKTTTSIQVRRQFQSLYLPLYLQNMPLPLPHPPPPQKQIQQQHQQMHPSSSSSSSSLSILQLAKRANYPPYLFCRLLVEQITDLSSLSLSPFPVPTTLPAVCQAATSRTDTLTTTIETTAMSPTDIAFTSPVNNISPRGTDPGVSGATKSTTPTNTTNTTTAKKKLTLAMRDPMGVLGDIRVIRPEYWASESFGYSHRISSDNSNDDDDDDVGTITPTTRTLRQQEQQQQEQHQQQQHPEHEQKQPQSNANNSPVTNAATTTDTDTDTDTSLLTTGTATTTTTRLAREVQEAIASDPMYGPKHDKERHRIGVEYEVLLEHALTEMEIPFETETQLRERGSSRTPDVLLTCPIGVQLPTTGEWKVVCWIDSKALFGDVETHATSVLPQAESYVHRFGPGMVLYWFGHAPVSRLGDAKGDIVIWCWDLPETFLWPTGEIGTRQTRQRPNDEPQQGQQQLPDSERKNAGDLEGRPNEESVVVRKGGYSREHSPEASSYSPTIIATTTLSEQ